MPKIHETWHGVMSWYHHAVVKKLRQEKALYVCRFAHDVDMFPLGTTSLLETRSDLQEAYTNSGKKFTTTW